MSAYTDKVQEWVDSMTMCEAAGIEPCYKYVVAFGQKLSIGTPEISDVKMHPERYAFPIAAIESNPVFVGDEPYVAGVPRTIVAADSKAVYWSDSTRIHTCFGYLEHCSWNPPKQKTVMVEMLVNDAESLRHTANPTIAQLRISDACRKALEGMK